MDSGYLQRVAVNRARFYLSLAGSPSLRWGEGTPLLTIIEDLNKKTDQLVCKTVDTLDCGIFQFSYEPGYLHWNDTFKLYAYIEDSAWGYLDFLPKLQKRRPEAYALIRKSLEMLDICPMSPMSSLTRYYDSYYEGMAFQEGGYDERTKQMIKAEVLAFKKHFDPPEYARHLEHYKGLVKLNAKCKKHLTEKEKAWVQKVLELLPLGTELRDLHAQNRIPIIDHGDNGCAIDDMYCLLWSPKGITTDDWGMSVTDGIDDMGFPAREFSVNSIEDLSIIKQYAKFHDDLYKIINEMYGLFNKKQKKEKRGAS